MRRAQLSVLLFLSLVPAAPASDAPIQAPRVGWLTDDGNHLRDVRGVAGNFIVGGAVAADVVSAASSARFALVKTGDSLLLLDSEDNPAYRERAPAGPALFAFAPDGSPALVYYPATGDLLRRDEGGALVPAPLADFAGKVIAISLPRRERVAMMVARDDGLWRLEASLATGTVESESQLPGVSAPLLPLSDERILFADGEQLVLRGRDGAEIRLPLPSGVQSMENMGDGWVHVRTTRGAHLAVRVTADGFDVFHVPGGAQ